MPITRVFLDGDEPPLVRAAGHLIARYRRDDRIDLSPALVVVPASRAGRRLEEILLTVAEPLDPAWVPPDILTVGRLPEHLYECKAPLASDLSQWVAWTEALRGMPPGTLDHVLGRRPDDDDFHGWLGIAKMLSSLHRELAAELIDFEMVAACVASLDQPSEVRRWRALAALERDYLARLDRIGLWDVQSARVFAVRHGECRTTKDIVLVGCVDLPGGLRAMLEQVADRVRALVIAEESEANRFDTFGALRPAQWHDVRLPLRDDQWRIVTSPDQQAQAVADWMAELGDAFATEEVAVGIPEASLAPLIRQTLDQHDLPSHMGAGVSAADTRPLQFLRQVESYLRSPTFDAFARLVRQPCVERIVSRTLTEATDDASPAPAEDWLTSLDRYQAEHLPGRVERQRVAPTRDGRILQRAIAILNELLSPFGEDDRPLDAWCDALAAVLVTVFQEDAARPDAAEHHDVVAGCDVVASVLQAWRHMPAPLRPRVSAVDALRLLLSIGGSQRVAEPATPGAIELLGWLELPWDDASAVVLTSFNEGTIPSSRTSDMFLPNHLRKRLGIEDNDRRLARDMWGLLTVLRSHREVRVITGRRSIEGEPLRPSRLLFACDDATMLRRALACFAEADETPALVLGPYGSPASRTRVYNRPEPRPLDRPIDSMRVTEFRDYLACPYRYYLRHHLRLETARDDAVELDGSAFGRLCHDVLKRFGDRAIVAAEETPSLEGPFFSAAHIERTLHEDLDTIVESHYGAQRPAAVSIQVEHIRLRLTAFAHVQAARFAAGWRIEQAEVAPADDVASIDTQDGPMFLRGRIDRIDIHEQTGQRVVLDYKTSDTPRSPEQTHRKTLAGAKTWVDLQLPLYRHLLEAMGLDPTAELAYFLLPKDPQKVGVAVAAWSTDDLTDADRTASRVASAVRRGEFHGVTRPAPPWFEEYAAICEETPW